MSDLISRESLKQRINLNYNSHQYIDTQSIKDIINTEPSVEDKTVEALEKIKEEIEEKQSKYTDRWVMGATDYPYGCYRGYEETLKLIDKHISKLKGE